MKDFPSEFDMLEAFGLEPHYVAPEDLTWSYEFVDEAGTRLRLSYDLCQYAIQTVLFIADRKVALVSHEGADFLRIRKDGFGRELLLAEFTHANVRTSLQITFHPTICVTWGSLREMN